MSQTNRIEAFRQEYINSKPMICCERARIFTESHKKTEGEAICIRRAKAFLETCKELPIKIFENELIVGTAGKFRRTGILTPEFSWQWVDKEMDTFDKRTQDPYVISKEQIEFIRKEIFPYWKGKSLEEVFLARIPEDTAKILVDTGIIDNDSKWRQAVGEVTPDYQDILFVKGYKGIKEDADKKIKELDISVSENIEKIDFYKSVSIVAQGIMTLAQRYSNLAKEMSKQETDEKRKLELIKISEICMNVPANPPTNFYEAIQFVWFVQLGGILSENPLALNLGRFDQYMYPYVKADLESGRETEESIVERLTNLWIKTITINKVRSQAHTFSSAGSPLYQNVTIGGQTRDKKDAVNPLSYLVLKSVAQTHLPQPNLTVRYHAGLDARFMNECIEVMKLGFGMPAFNNDEIIIPSFISKGVLEEDAYDYSAIGCVETAVPGKWGYRCTGMSYMNFPKVLLITMNDGIDPASGKRFAPSFGHFKDMKSFDELQTAWDKTLRHLTRMSVIVENSIDLSLEREVPDILCSALTDDCIGRGKEIQEMLIHDAPKYGNDDDYADSLVREAYDIYVDEIAKYPNT
ncbi:MAG: pyruvate formate lyase family protein, partial [Clostridioides difficile]|nr:pyruvate formate lyase family protein [Clostridioides difficile]